MSSLDVSFQTALIGTSTIAIRTLELLNDSVATLLQMHIQSRLRMVEFTTFWTHRLKMMNLNYVQGYQLNHLYEIVYHRPHVTRRQKYRNHTQKCVRLELGIHHPYVCWVLSPLKHRSRCKSSFRIRKEEGERFKEYRPPI